MFDSSPAFMHGLCFWLPVPTRQLVCPGYRRGLSVLARAVSRRAHGSWTTPGLTRTRDCVPASIAFPSGAHGRHPKCAFRSSIPGPSMPLSTLHPAPRGTQRKTRGQDGSLLLSCGALSSPTARRFIPTIALHCNHAGRIEMFNHLHQRRRVESLQAFVPIEQRALHQMNSLSLAVRHSIVSESG
jgi:hypothetical protein